MSLRARIWQVMDRRDIPQNDTTTIVAYRLLGDKCATMFLRLGSWRLVSFYGGEACELTCPGR